MTSSTLVELAEAWDALDAWCEQRARQVSERAGRHIMAGGRLDAPRYRTMLGESRAYLAMRSFIHGARAHNQGENSNVRR